MKKDKLGINIINTLIESDTENKSELKGLYKVYNKKEKRNLTESKKNKKKILKEDNQVGLWVNGKVYWEGDESEVDDYLLMDIADQASEEDGKSYDTDEVDIRPLEESAKILKEDYEVGGKREKDAIKAMRNLYDMLESCTNKYINDKVIQSAYKITKAKDSYMDNFKTNPDLLPQLIEKVDIGGLTVGIYAPLIIDMYNDVLEIWPSTYLSASRSGMVLDDVYGGPGFGFDSDWDYIQLTGDGNIGYEMSLDGEHKQELLKDTLILLDNKEEVLQIYKAHCKSIAQTILSKANEMSLSREKDIANKQREFSKAVNEEEEIKNKKVLNEETRAEYRNKSLSTYLKYTIDRIDDTFNMINDRVKEINHYLTWFNDRLFEDNQAGFGLIGHNETEDLLMYLNSLIDALKEEQENLDINNGNISEEPIEESVKTSNKKLLKEELNDEDDLWLLTQVENNLNNIIFAVDKRFDTSMGYDERFCNGLAGYLQEEIEEWLEYNSEDEEDEDYDEDMNESIKVNK